MHSPSELVRAAQQDVPGALDRLVDAWLPVVLAWCVRLAGRGVHPEDAAHDVFEVVLTRLDRLRTPEAFPAWLYGITRRVIVAHQRRAWLRRWAPMALFEVPEPDADLQFGPENQEIVVRVRDALQQLSLPHREVLVLCDLEERSDSEVAALLGVPRATVKSRLRRAREALRGLCADLDETPVRLQAIDGGAAEEDR